MIHFQGVLMFSSRWEHAASKDVSGIEQQPGHTPMALNAAASLEPGHTRRVLRYQTLLHGVGRNDTGTKRHLCPTRLTVQGKEEYTCSSQISVGQWESSAPVVQI